MMINTNKEIKINKNMAMKKERNNTYYFNGIMSKCK